MMQAFRPMYADAAAPEIRPLRRRCYGNLYLTLTGAFLHAGKGGKWLHYLARVSPPGLRDSLMFLRLPSAVFSIMVI